MRRLLLAALATVSLAASFGLPAPAAAATTPPKVAIIVGPVGSLTPTYLHLAELAATAAAQRGATVARAYSPNATPANVLAAVADANVVIYFGHGYGHPSPYGGLNAARQNGWGLQGPSARGTHADGLNGELVYLGEDWIVANARPAPGFVMIYSNTCYAPGASEGGHAPANESTALQRVGHYSRKVFRMGGSAYYATDFDRGAAQLVGDILDRPEATYGSIFASDPRYVPSALRGYGHPFSAGQQVWLHRTKYTDGPPNYWYAFAGNPDAVPARSWDQVAPAARLTSAVTDVKPGASLELEISEPVPGLDGASLALVDAAGAAVEAEVTYDAAAGAATIRPTHPLQLSASYVVRLAAGLADVAGNPLPDAGWKVTTRIDSDPLARELPIVLADGAHELVRFDHRGAIIERQPLEVADERWLNASSRARIPGQRGSWLEISSAPLAGWWVAESAAARALGVLDPASYASAEITLPAGEYALHAIEGPVVQATASVTLREDRAAAVDARVVVDGQLYLRVAPDRSVLAGRWLRVDPTIAPDESRAQRVSADVLREEPAHVTLPVGDWRLYRFDGSGRVIERRTVSADGTLLTTARTLEVGGARFFILAGADLDGWAIREDPRIVVTPPRPITGEHS